MADAELRTVDPVPEPDVSSVDPSAAPAGRARSGAFGVIAGGVVAAGLGFGLAVYGMQQGWPFLSPQTADLAALQAEVSRLSEALQQEQSRPAPVVDLAAFDQRIAALETRPPSDADLVAGLQAQIAALEQRLATMNPGDSAAIAAEIDAQVQLKLKEAEAEANGLKAEAEGLRKAAEQRAALLQLKGALELGRDVDIALAAVADQGIALPEALTQVPPSLQDLQTAFPDAARAALLAARQAQMEGTVTDRLTTFLKAQTGVRSLEVREGDDPDAVLSRAEALLAKGDVAAARAELTALPAPGQDALSDWAAQAEAHLAAQAALAALIPAE